MKITIVGAGRIGLHLAKYLSSEHQDVYLVDTDSSKLAILESDFNMRTFVGEPTDFKILREAEAENADIFVAVTADTSDNLVACTMAKSMGAKRTIARVERDDFMEAVNEDVVRRMGVDHTVNPDLLAAKTIINSLKHPWCRSWDEFDQGEIILTAVSLAVDAPIVGHQLKDMSADSKLFHVSALRRQNSTIIPRGNDYVMPDDILYITSTAAGISRIMELTGKQSYDISRVVIMGGSKVAELISKLASDVLSITIVEKDLERCRQLTASCPDSDIIYGDASEEEVLIEAGISKADAFIALSDSSESNILSCLTAADAGARKTVAEIEREQFIEKAEGFGVGSIINKPIITANAIYQLILDAGAYSSKCFAMTHADVARMKIKEDSYLTSAPVKDLRLPSELTFAGYISNHAGEIVTGLTHFKGGEEVIVFCLNGALNKVYKLFRK